MSEKNAGDFKNVDAVTEHVERLVDGWASVIRCKASQFGGPSCDHIIMIVFRDFYRPAPGTKASRYGTRRRRCSAKAVRSN